MGKGGVDKTQEEIFEEMAKALGHTGSLLESLLEELSRLDSKMAGIEEPEEYNLLVDKFNATRENALFRKEMLMIHREALGFTKHRFMDKTYPVPAKKTRR